MLPVPFRYEIQTCLENQIQLLFEIKHIRLEGFLCGSEEGCHIGIFIGHNRADYWTKRTVEILAFAKTGFQHDLGCA